MRKIATQIQLDQDQYNAVQSLAKDKGWSMAEIIRRALAEYLNKPRKGKEE
jgi:predicted transcriptional regulator